MPASGEQRHVFMMMLMTMVGLHVSPDFVLVSPARLSLSPRSNQVALANVAEFRHYASLTAGFSTRDAPSAMANVTSLRSTALSTRHRHLRQAGRTCVPLAAAGAVALLVPLSVRHLRAYALTNTITHTNTHPISHNHTHTHTQSLTITHTITQSYNLSQSHTCIRFAGDNRRATWRCCGRR